MGKIHWKAVSLAVSNAAKRPREMTRRISQLGIGKTRLWLAAAILFSSAAGLASANTITTFGTNSITQTFTYASAPTDATQAQTTGNFSYFQSAGAPVGAVLQDVKLTYSLDVTISSLDFTNLDTTINAAVENFTYLSYVGFDAFGTLPSGDLTRLTQGLPSKAVPVYLYSLGDQPNGLTQEIDRNQAMALIGPAPSNLPNNATLVSPNPDNVGAYSADNGNGLRGVYGAADRNPYNFATSITSLTPSAYNTNGNFSLAYDTSVKFAISGGGGNLAFNQTTVTNGSYSVTYDYTVPGVPEPSTWAMIAGGLLLLGFRGRRLTSRRAS
jgi:hypothetical protein